MKRKYAVFDLLTVDEIIVGLYGSQAKAARSLKCKQPSVWKWVKDNRLPPRRQDWLLLWKWKELKELVAKKHDKQNNQQSAVPKISD